MSKAGDVYENPVTGEFGYMRVGTKETNGELVVADLRVRPGGAVLGAHIHPTLDERFTVLKGKIGYMRGDQIGILQAGDAADLPRGIPHDSWNAGAEDSYSLRPAWTMTEYSEQIARVNRAVKRISAG